MTLHQIWNLEMETGKAQKRVSDVAGTYNNLARSLDLPQEYEIDLIDLRGSISFWKVDLLNMLREKKKAIRQATYEMENRVMSQDEENVMNEEILQDKKNELAKLQNKILFIDQDIKITKNDIEVEVSKSLID
ncbi:uncharacterized protein LOC134783174 [Penaeus indicus]|uniref:uncharacterized protein LOC134783174 n=1 Tax=Penaeus indicus TaxID=29960 RepID=UPI00300C0E89